MLLLGPTVAAISATAAANDTATAAGTAVVHATERFEPQRRVVSK